MAAPVVMEQLTLVCSDGTQYKIIVNSGEAYKLRTDAEYATQCVSRLQQLYPGASKPSEQAVEADTIKPIVQANSSPKETCDSVPQETSPEDDNDIDTEYATECVSTLQQPSEHAVEADANKETCHIVPQETSKEDDDDIGKNSVGSAAEVPIAETIYKCDICDDIYSSKWNLKRHLHEIHKQTSFVKSRTNKNKCYLCDCACASLRDLERHCAEVHVMRLAKETLRFSSEKEFLKWREQIEKESAAHYVKRKGTTRKKNGEVVENFYCHRSGEFHTRGTGKKHLKNKGSNKIGATCPSRIRVTKKRNQSIEVFYLKTHIGHTADLHRLPLTDEERRSVAIKLAQNVPITEILNSVKDSTCPGKTKRIHLLTRKDILNIKDEYRSKPLNQVPREKDANSVSASFEIGSRTAPLNDKELTVSADGAGSNTTCTAMLEMSVGLTFAQGNAYQKRKTKMMHEFEDTNKTFKKVAKNINTNEELASLHKIHVNYKAQLEHFCLTRSKTATLFSGGKNNQKKTTSTKQNNKKNNK